MKLSNTEIKFIKANKEILSNIFKNDLEETKEKVFNMPEGKERNLQIEFVKKYKEWLSNIGFCSHDAREPDTDI